MVERILAAGREILLARGYERTTTGRIAAEAGISPGSLYQYFPNKEAVLAQVLDRYAEDAQRRITDAFVANLSAAEQVRSTVAALLDALDADGELLRVVYEQLPRSANPQRAEFVRRIEDLVVTALLFQGHTHPARASAMAWTLVRTIESVTVGYVLDSPQIARAAVVDELTALVTGYLGFRAGDEGEAASGRISPRPTDGGDRT